ncbi:MAG: phospholipase A [Xanthomonadales bacterium]|nr:phospholipase A [Burkholderiaceae bacterium]MCU0989363.1 phospholipase A [Xanthomonadales bacterium]
MEQGDRFTLTGEFWAGASENDADDDNPVICDLVGQAEVSAAWCFDRTNTLGLTLRHSLRSSARCASLPICSAAMATRSRTTTGAARC